MNEFFIYGLKHWNGNLPLWKSYWVNSILLTTLFSLLAGFVIGILAAIAGVHSEKTLKLLGVCAAIPIMIWSIRGTWIAADRYNLEHPGISWGVMAQLALLLGIINNVLYALTI